MNNSGIVRRIDELGRIVIPKELRRTMRLKEGDEMEISATGDTLMLKKYSGFESVLQIARSVSKQLADAVDADVLFVNTESVSIAEGKNKKYYNGLKLTDEFANFVRKRRAEILHGEALENVFENGRPECTHLVIEPIVVNGDLVGACVLMLEGMPNDVTRAYLNFCSRLLESALS